MAEVLAPAIEIAEQGFPISETLADALASSRTELAKFPSTTKIWFKDGRPLEMGDILINKDLATTLRGIATQPDAFYRGEIARQTAACMKANGGLITEADLASYQAFEDVPVRINYRGIDVFGCPPNSQGFVMIEALNILEGFDLKRMGQVRGKLLTPAALRPSVRDELASKRHQLDLRNVRGVGSVKGIMVHQKTGVLMGGVSPTGDSYVMAW